MIPILVLTYMVAPLAIAFIILRRRNRVSPEHRVSGVVYLAQFVGANTALVTALIAVGSAYSIFENGSAIDAIVNVAPFSPWPLPDPFGVERDGAYVMAADIDQVRLAVAQADVGTRLLQALGGVVTAIPVVTIGVFVAILCERIIQRRPFAPQLVKLAGIGAGVFLVAGFAGQLLSGLAATRLSEIAFALIRDVSPSAETPTPTWPWPIEFWPVWGALALSVLAILIRHGMQLQRDTEGLV